MTSNLLADSLTDYCKLLVAVKKQLFFWINQPMVPLVKDDAVIISRSTLVDLLLKLPGLGVDGPSEGVEQRHEQAEIAVLLPVMQA
jgi:hypothetical protein